MIVVGDDADEATAEAVRALGDPRVTYRNLTQRLEFTDDADSHWLVASTLARNEAMRLATGSWVVCFDDDDAMAPNCVERLLARAREERFEAVYGRTTVHMNGPPDVVIGAFPPRLGDFTLGERHVPRRPAFLRPRARRRRPRIARRLVPGSAHASCRCSFRVGREILADYYPSRLHEPETPD